MIIFCAARQAGELEVDLVESLCFCECLFDESMLPTSQLLGAAWACLRQKELGRNGIYLPHSFLPNFCFSANIPSMKATLTVTSRGVVSLPAKMRQAIGIKADDVLIAETTHEGILLRPSVTLPVEIYSADRIREFEEEERALEEVLRRKSLR